LKPGNAGGGNLTKGQRAMLVAKMYPEGGKRSPAKKGEKRVSSETEVFSTRLSVARAVLRYSESLADSVIKGDPPALSLEACKK
jgi:hypothetical protein